MPASREMDVLVAELVMGFVRPADVTRMTTLERQHWGHYAIAGDQTQTPHLHFIGESYSSDIMAAWEVVEKLQHDYHEFFFQADAEWTSHGLPNYAAKFD